MIENKGNVAVVAEARYTKEEKEYVGVASISISKVGKFGQTIAVWQDGESGDDLPYMLGPTVIVDREEEDNEVIVHFGGYCQNGEPLKKTRSSSSCLWEPGILTGNFKEKSFQNNEEYLEWEKSQTARTFFKGGDVLKILEAISMKEFIGR